MYFRRRHRDEPEINVIPFIDILLVVLIFMFMSTTFSRFTELQVTLPVADAEKLRDRPKEIVISIAGDGRYAINGELLEGRDVATLSQEMARRAQGQTDMVLIISADAHAAHQAVINAMDAARRAGLHRLTFATQQPDGAAR